jgi:predicted Kef-type K+ transport protein
MMVRRPGFMNQMGSMLQNPAVVVRSAFPLFTDLLLTVRLISRSSACFVITNFFDHSVQDQIIAANPQLAGQAPMIRQMLQSEQFRSFL